MDYIIQAVACFVPVFWFAAAIIVFLKRDVYREASLESHFRWQGLYHL